MNNSPSTPQTQYRATDKSLAEQLQINDREIAYRKDLLFFTDEDAKYLSNLKSLITDNADEIVNEFYRHQLDNSEISLLIGDAETLDRLRLSMRRYILELFEGFYDSEYVNKRLRIGKVHKRIGVSPKLYVSAVNLMQSVLEKFIAEHPKDKKDCEDCEKQRNALRKLLMFDMQLVFDTYISSLVAEVEVARTELEEYAASLESTIAERTEQLREISSRDGLTSLYNQRSCMEHLRRELSVAERQGDALSLVYFDLNSFKKLNDTKGHIEGDRLLEEVAAAMKASVRSVDFGCRYGGDEFCIIMPRTQLDKARSVADRMVKNFDKKTKSNVTFSVGIMQSGPENHLSADELIKTADKLMFKAKAKSKKKSGHYIEA